MTQEGPTVRIQLLGGFEVAVGERIAPASAWSRRHAAALVKLLALRPSRRAHREQVIDLLWPDDPLETAATKLHKAAHHARRVTGHPGTIVLGGELVQLFPGLDVAVDVDEFEREAGRALAEGEPSLAAAALERYRGELLPDDVYDDWVVGARERLRRLDVDLLALLARWDDVLAVDPAHERAHLELMRRHAAAGDRCRALRQFDRLDRTLRAELGVSPGPEATGLRDRLAGGDGDVAPDGAGPGGDAMESSPGRTGASPDEAVDRGGSVLVRRAVELGGGLGWRVGVGVGRLGRRGLGACTSARRRLQQPVPATAGALDRST